MDIVTQARRSRFAGTGGRDIRVSFEFFPPKTDEMEKTLWESIERLAPLAAVRVGHLRGRRLDPRAHPRDREAHPGRDRADAGGASHLRGGDPRRGRRRDRELSDRRACATSWRCAAIRWAASAIALRAASGRLSQCRRPGRRHQPPVRFRNLGLGLSGKASRQPDGRGRHRHAQGQGRCRRGPAPSPSSSSRTISTSAISIACARGIAIPIVPGILPVQNFKQTRAFAQRCGASVPGWLAERFDGLDDDAATRKLIAAAVAAEQVLDLVDRGVTDFHFYTMNRADLVYAICTCSFCVGGGERSPSVSEAALPETTEEACPRSMTRPGPCLTSRRNAISQMSPDLSIGSAALARRAVTAPSSCSTAPWGR